MTIKLQLPKLADLKPRITVVGIGGAGCNAINNMISAGLVGVEFVVANTDAQALAASNAEHRIQLGINLTEGLGAGSKPEIGEAAAEESLDDIRAMVNGTHMLFIAAGMGGGTGTGAASVIARIAKDLGILTVAVVTKPFLFEGARRMRIAEAGVEELKKHVDTLIVIPNQNLFRVSNERTTFAEAFVLADQVLYSGIACIVDLIVKEGLINLDLADVRTVLSGMGSAMMGTGEASGERRAILAAEEAIANPLLDDISLRGAHGLLLSIIGGRDLTLYEVDEAASRVRQEVDPDANIIVGATFDETIGDRVRVSIVASGMLRPGELPRPIPKVTPGQAGALNGTRAAHGNPNGAGGRAHNGPPPLPSKQPQQPAAAAIPQQPLANQPQTSRPLQPAAPADTWRGPGGVNIEERSGALFEQLSGRPRVQQPHGGESRAPESPAAGPAGKMAPANPADGQKSGRRMPEVGEFPLVGQRDYHAKTNPAADPTARGDSPRVYQPAPAAGAKKSGFFQRLTGGNKTNEKKSAAAAGQSDNVAEDQLPTFFNKKTR